MKIEETEQAVLGQNFIQEYWGHSLPQIADSPMNSNYLSFFLKVKDWSREVSTQEVPNDSAVLQQDLLTIDSPVNIIIELENTLQSLEPNRSVKIDFSELIIAHFDLANKFPSFAMLLHLFNFLKFLTERTDDKHYLSELFKRIELDDGLSLKELEFTREIREDLTSLVSALEMMQNYLLIMALWGGNIIHLFIEYMENKITLFENILREKYIDAEPQISTTFSVEEVSLELVALIQLRDFVTPYSERIYHSLPFALGYQNFQSLIKAGSSSIPRQKLIEAAPLLEMNSQRWSEAARISAFVRNPPSH